MRFSVGAQALRQAISIASLPVRRSDAAIMECLRVEAKDNRLRLVGSSFEVQCQTICEASVPQAGELCLNAADLKAVTQRMSGVINAQATQAGLELSCGQGRMNLPAIAGTLPKMARPSGEEEIEGGVEAYLSCVDFAATDETKWHLMGVCLSGGIASATDGQVFFYSPLDGGSGQTIPSSARQIIQKIGGRLFVSQDMWRVENEGCAALGRLIDSKPIDMSAHTPVKNPVCSLSADDLKGAIEATTVGRAEWCVVIGGEGQITASGDKFKGLHIEGHHGLTCQGHAPSFVSGTKNLLQAIAPFEGQEIDLSTDGRVLRFDGSNGYTLLAPLRDARTQLEAA